MPTTINGIGTRYYGRKNRTAREGTCRTCGRAGKLESHDTRLWFVILFIPIIPLGRKRVIDKCPHCLHHFVADAGAFEAAREEETAEALERFRANPSPEVALEAHAKLMSYRDYRRAAEFRRGAIECFPDDPAMIAVLAGHLEHFGIDDEAEDLHERVLELRPDSPEARVGVAQRRRKEGDLDEARRHLSFLEAPGAGEKYPLVPLQLLSEAYQKAGRHEEVLAISGHILRELPDVGRQHAFRKFVKASEKAAGSAESLLPESRRTIRGLFDKEDNAYSPRQRAWIKWGFIGGAALAGLLISNEYIRRNRTLHVANASGKPMQVSVDDGDPITVDGLGKIPLAEGTHRVQVSGPFEESHEVVVESGFFDRWFRKPVWVLNPGGEAVLAEWTLHYAEQPLPASRRLIVGESVVHRPHVDYPFEAPPGQLKVKKREKEVVKTQIEWVDDPDADVEAIRELAAANPGTAMAFGERRLRRDPDRLDLLEAYLQAIPRDQVSRGEEFLATGLDRRPVAVQWHRIYQQVADFNGHADAALAHYDAMVKAEPSDGRLLYLRGRIDPDPAREGEFFRRAIEADPKEPWPWYALALEAGAAGHWDESLEAFRKAEGLGMQEEVLESLDLEHIARLAKGDLEALDVEYRAQLAANPLKLSAIIFLCEVLAGQGKADEIEPAVAAWEASVPSEARPQFAPMIRVVASFIQGDYSGGAVQPVQEGLWTSSLRVVALLAADRLDGVIADGSLAAAWEDPWNALALGLALEQAGRTEEAKPWRDRAAGALAGMMREEREAAEVLGADRPPALDDLHRIIITPQNKALLLATLAGRFPERRVEYLAEAERFNMRRIGFYPLVKRAIDAGKGKSGAP